MRVLYCWLGRLGDIHGFALVSAVELSYYGVTNFALAEPRPRFEGTFLLLRKEVYSEKLPYFTFGIAPVVMKRRKNTAFSE
jgi:hypothetical protein